MNYKHLLLPITVIVVLTTITGCSQKEPKDLSIKLEPHNYNEAMFEPGSNEFPLLFLFEKYTNLNGYLEGKYKKLPKTKYRFVNYCLGYKKLYFYLYKNSIIPAKEFSELAKKHNIDTTQQAIRSDFTLFTGVTGIDDQKRQFLILDTNNNMDFGDDELQTFSKTTNSIKNNAKQPTHKVQTSIYFKNNLEKLTRSISVSPNPDYYIFQHTKDTFARRLGVVAKFTDYWKTNTKLNQEDLEIRVYGFSSTNPQIFIKKSDQKFSSNDYLFNNSIKYRLKDTLHIAKKAYLIDSVGLGMKSIHLKRINSIEYNEKRVGFRIGEYVSNYEITMLNTEVKSIYEFLGTKYTLLDFWGTWCGPCKEMTPKLKNMDANLSDKMQIIGIAYRDNEQSLAEYVEKQMLEWPQALIKDDKAILNSLAIEAYPTYILLDKKGKIMYHGGSASLKEIEKIIQEHN